MKAPIGNVLDEGNCVRVTERGRKPAIFHARSWKGPWHMTKYIATGVGLTNAWLATQELISLKTLWASLAQLR